MLWIPQQSGMINDVTLSYKMFKTELSRSKKEVVLL